MKQPCTLALDIGGTSLVAAVVLGNEVLHTAEVPTLAHRGGQAVLADVIALAKQVALEAANQSARLSGAQVAVSEIGVASAGVVDPELGTITAATDLMPGWAGTDLKGTLEEATGLPTFVLGDVLAHGLGEHHLGAGKPHASTMTLGVGTGIGGALVTDAGPRFGAHGVAGHLGHLPHPAAAGLPCSCGRTGHVESVSSGTAISDRYQAKTGQELSGRQIAAQAKVEAEQEGGGPALAVLQQAGFALGETIGGLCNTWDPEAVILSGSVAAAGPLWWDAVREGFAAGAMDPVAQTPLLLGDLGGDAPLLGAALYAREQMGQ